MGARERRRISKLISLLLRHDPQRAGLELDPAGWIEVDELLSGMRRLGVGISRGELEDVVRGGDKPRFELRGDRIRARYGHSVEVDLAYEPAPPPPVLYHGTTATRVVSIQREGISPRERQQVHLSGDVETAAAVGARHGRAVVLAVDARSMAEDGATFHRLPGGTWLTDAVPPSAVLGPVSRERP